MKIGIFDSGLGGLIIAKAIHKMMPEYDYVYLGDTKRVPYGNRSYETVFKFTEEAVDYLFRKENCVIVIIACNTASARALRKMQEEYLPKYFPATSGGKIQRKILGVLIPAAEECVGFEKIGILATRGTVDSNTFPKEIRKINRTAVVFQNAASMLVPLAEEGENALAKDFIKKYLKPLLQKNIQALVLGCTHYPIFKEQIKKEIKKLLPLGHSRTGKAKNVKIISQDEIIPKKLKKYLAEHPELSKKLSTGRKVKILVTDKTKTVEKLTGEWFGKKVKAQLVEI